jgi:hypothetical protein
VSGPGTTPPVLSSPKTLGPPGSTRRKLGRGVALMVALLVVLSGTSLASATPLPSRAGAGPGAGPSVPLEGRATVTIANESTAKSLPWSFWGANVVAAYPFTTSSAAKVSATPVTFLRFPGGGLGEEFNYTSSLVTNSNGSTLAAATSIQEFITACDAIHCHAILQLPAEIDQNYTAAYYANYVVNVLHFKPAYWEIGNAVPGWTHYGVPWSLWSTQNSSAVTPVLFAQLVGHYIAAVKAVDPGAQFIALGAAMGVPGYDQYWVTNLTLLDGHALAGISIHSYAMGKSPVGPATWSELLANLTGVYSLPDQVAADRGYIKAACPSCTINLFVSEANAAESNTFTPLDSSFAGTLYVAADTAQALDLRLTNLDWFCYDCNFSGSWENRTTGAFELQYTLMSQMMPALGNETLATTVSGLPTLFAAATYGTSGLGLLLVNTNLDQNASFSLASTGIHPGSAATRDRWTNGSTRPHTSTITLGNLVTVPPLTVEILQVAPSGFDGGSPPPHGTVQVRTSGPTGVTWAAPLVPMAVAVIRPPGPAGRPT